MFFLYSFVLTVGFIVLLPRFLWDALTKGKYADGFWQRLGYLPDFDFANRRIIWLHCVSVGEANAAKPLVKALRQNFPDYNLIVSTTTKTGQQLAREFFKQDAALVFYFPFDWRFVVRRVLQKIKPAAILIVETELWFNFLREARRANAKVALVNGRLSEKSFKNYRLINRFMRRVLANLDLALMNDEADAKRIVELGCAPGKVLVTGNIKFDLPIESSENDLTEYFRERFAFKSKRPIIVAASTHEPEEKIILTAFKQLCSENQVTSPRLIIVPRHPERFDRIADLCEKSGLRFVRRSAQISTNDRHADVMLLDSIGELRAIYPLADIVFVGGSLIPHGGQNVLEPAAAKKPVVTGFYTLNFARIVKDLKEKNALVQLPETNLDLAAQVLYQTFADLLADKTAREIIAANAVHVLNDNSGATIKTVEHLKSLLANRKIF